MENFVNRETELRSIEDTFASLLMQRNMGRTPIYEFHGVGGIGKTWMLRKVEESCNDMHLPYIWADASKRFPDFWHAILAQVRKYHAQFTQQQNEQDLLKASILATQTLLSQGPVVMLMDSLDAADQEQLKSIETLLRGLIDDNRLFVVLASKKMIGFNNSRPIARKLVSYQLQPFDYNSCTSYLHKILHTIDPAMHDVIFQWTKGYPLAVNIIVQEIREKHLDLGREQDRKHVWGLLVDQVIERGVFSDVVKPPSNLDWYRTMLSLLSIPRRSNTSIFQKLIEAFAPHYARPSHFAYMTLHRQINQVTVVLDWNPAKSAYSVEASIRNIFMMRLKIEELDLYYKIHSFLAQFNRRQAEGVSGTDRIRYLQEYLYHSANCADTSDLSETVEKTVQQIVTETKLNENFTTFYQDFLRDEELKASLGEHAKIAISLIYKELALLNRQLALDASGSDPIFSLHEFFTYVIIDPLATDFPSLLKEHIQQVRKTFPTSISSQLYEKLVNDDKIKSTLGEHSALFSLLIDEDFS